MAADARRRVGRYVPLVYRVAGLNAALLVAAVVVTLVVLSPHKLSTVAADEAAILFLSLALVAIVNLIVLRRVMGPIVALTALARKVDLNQPSMRMPDASARAEAGELSLTFNEMLDRLDAERRDATGRVLAAQESERLRIAQELHDQIGQELTAVLLGLARVRAASSLETQRLVEDVQDAVRASLEDVRRIALELRPEALDDLGLVSALAVLGERMAERARVRVEQTIDAEVSELDADVELVIYRVAQEALTNVVRHSGVDHAQLTLRRDGEAVVLEVVDHGRGLPASIDPGTGMRGMQERAALVGGRLEIDAGDDGTGCRICLRVPRVGAPPGSVEAGNDAAEDPDPAR